MTRMLPLLAALLLAGSALPAAAQPEEGEGPRAHLREMMKKADTNGDGAVDKAEFEAAGKTRFAEIDRNGDGRISKEEVTAHAAARAAQRGEEMFARADADGDGTVTAAEFATVEARLFERMDRNDDGKLNRADRPGRDGGR